MLPGFVAILALSFVYTALGDVAIVEGLFFGLKAAVLAVVLEALARIGVRVLKNYVMGAIAALSFASIFFFNAPFPAIVGVAGTASSAPGVRRTLRVVVTGFLAWIAPIGTIAWLPGPSSVYAQEGFFFSEAAVAARLGSADRASHRRACRGRRAIVAACARDSGGACGSSCRRGLPFVDVNRGVQHRSRQRNCSL